jgi:hypothetical protein
LPPQSIITSQPADEFIMNNKQEKTKRERSPRIGLVLLAIVASLVVVGAGAGGLPNADAVKKPKVCIEFPPPFICDDTEEQCENREQNFEDLGTKAKCMTLEQAQKNAEKEQKNAEKDEDDV